MQKLLLAVAAFAATLSLATAAYLAYGPARRLLDDCAKPRTVLWERDLQPTALAIEEYINGPLLAGGEYKLRGKDASSLDYEVKHAVAIKPGHVRLLVEIGEGKTDLLGFIAWASGSQRFDVTLGRECNDGGWTVTKFEKVPAQQPPASTAATAVPAP
ncbi:MAG: hypothetical protein HY323_05590 [Betaproteobacteria bacterium]|nr:hypothetical protein [Betaproteobacteria bacterium]